MNNQEASMVNEWNPIPSKGVLSPEEYGNALKGWIEKGDSRPTPMTRQGGGGRMQDRTTRLSLDVEARAAMVVR